MTGDPEGRTGVQDDPHRETLDRLLGFLAQDPANPALLRDAAQAAMQADAPEQARDLLGRLEETGDFGPADRNLAAIAAMRAGEPGDAVRLFEALLAENPGDAALSFNLAWARALAKDFAGARAALDDAAIAALPQAALLDVQLMHDAGAFEDAAKRARAHLARHGDYPPLLAAVSVLAMDVEDEELARDCARRAGDHPDALATLGTLALTEDGPEAARPLLEKALALDPASPRAWVSLGLASLAVGRNAAAGAEIDRGARLFGDHLGSWIAAGWAYLLADDRALAEERFRKAHDLDPNFAEAQGSLAVLDALAGDRDMAERRIAIARRLDRQCFSAAFAGMLIAAGEGEGEGDVAGAGQRLEQALRQPIDAQGRTLQDIIARLAR